MQRPIEVILAVGSERVAVRGRLAAILGYLAAHRDELGLDQSDNGRLAVDFGSANLKASVTHYLPPMREPV